MSRSQMGVVLGLGLSQVIAFACSFYLMGAIGDAIAHDLGLSAAFVFSTVSVALAVSAFATPEVAQYMDRKGGKGVLLASHLAFALGLALLASAHDGVALAAAMAVIGYGMALGLSPTPFAILVALYGREARAPLTAVALIGGLGSVVGWPVASFLAERVGWRGACFVWAGVQLIVGLPLTALACPRAAGREAHTKSPAQPPVRWDRTMVQLAVLFACAWFVSTCMSAHLPRLLRSFGLTPRAATITAGLMGLAAFGLRFAEFTVLRRLPPIATTRAATLMHPAGAAALEAFGGGAAAAMAIGQGAGNGMLTVAKGVLPLSLYGPANYAYRSALLTRPALFAQIAGPSVYALLLERSGALAIAASSALCLVMFAMTFGLARHPAHAKEHAPA